MNGRPTQPVPRRRWGIAVLLAGVCFYGLLMGRIEPVPDLPARDTAPTAAGVHLAK